MGNWAVRIPCVDAQLNGDEIVNGRIVRREILAHPDLNA